jgi:hypothetical protein
MCEPGRNFRGICNLPPEIDLVWVTITDCTLIKNEK